MIELTTIFHRAPDVRYRIVDGEGVVIRQTAGEALVLNEVGARILELVDGESSVQDLLPRLRGEYEIDPATLEKDVLAYLDQLLEAGVIEDSAVPRAS